MHLKMTRKLGDFLVVGVLDDDTVETYKRRPVIGLEERMAVIFRIKGAARAAIVFCNLLLF